MKISLNLKANGSVAAFLLMLLALEGCNQSTQKSHYGIEAPAAGGGGVIMENPIERWIHVGGIFRFLMPQELASLIVDEDELHVTAQSTGGSLLTIDAYPDQKLCDIFNQVQTEIGFRLQSIVPFHNSGGSGYVFNLYEDWTSLVNIYRKIAVFRLAGTNDILKTDYRFYNDPSRVALEHILETLTADETRMNVIRGEGDALGGVVPIAEEANVNFDVSALSGRGPQVFCMEMEFESSIAVNEP